MSAVMDSTEAAPAGSVPTEVGNQIPLGNDLEKFLDQALAGKDISGPKESPKAEVEQESKPAVKKDLSELFTSTKENPDEGNEEKRQVPNEGNEKERNESRSQKADGEKEILSPEEQGQLMGLKAEREKRKEAQNRVAELEARLKELESNPPVPSEYERQLEAAKQRINEYENRLAISDLEATDVYKRQVAEPMAAAHEAIKSVVELSGLESGEVYDLLKISNTTEFRKAFREVAGDLNPIDQQELRQALDKVRELKPVEEGLRQNAKEMLERIKRHQDEQMQAERERYLRTSEKAFTETWKAFEDSRPWIKAVAQDEEGLREIMEIQRAAQEALDPNSEVLLDPHRRAATVYSARLLPLVENLASQLAEQLQATKAELAKYQSATPGISPQTTAGGSRQIQSDKNKSLEQYLTEALGVR